MMKVPNFEDLEVTKFLVELVRELDKTEKVNMSKITANHSLLLQAPNLKVYEVTVDNAGVLVISPVATPAAKRMPR